jgi:hypothetical protein
MGYHNLVYDREGVFLFTTVPGPAHAASFAILTGDTFPRVKRQRLEDDHSPAPSIEGKYGDILPFTEHHVVVHKKTQGQVIYVRQLGSVDMDCMQLTHVEISDKIFECGDELSCFGRNRIGSGVSA